jgi:hypothetical protein
MRFPHFLTQNPKPKCYARTLSCWRWCTLTLLLAPSTVTVADFSTCSLMPISFVWMLLRLVLLALMLGRNELLSAVHATAYRAAIVCTRIRRTNWW